MTINLAFSAPEVVRAFLEGRDSMQHIDVVLHDMWGVGCLVYFMLTNHRPYNVTGDSTELTCPLSHVFY